MFAFINQSITKMKERILEIIKQENLTNAEFANRLNVSPSTISSVLTGRNNASLDVISKIHQVFHINLEWLLYGKGDMRTDSTGNHAVHGMPDLFAENPENAHTAADNSKYRKETAPKGSENALNMPMQQVVMPPAPPARKITEIRIFFDDNTYETFKPGK